MAVLCCLRLAILWVGMQSVIVVFPVHAYFLHYRSLCPSSFAIISLGKKFLDFMYVFVSECLYSSVSSLLGCLRLRQFLVVLYFCDSSL